MRVRVLFFGALRDLAGHSEEALDVDGIVTVGALWEHLRKRFPATAQAHAASILFAKNHEFAPATTPLNDGDEVAFLPPVSGGAPAPCRLTRDPIDSRLLAMEVQARSDGAVVTFEGVVRNHSGGRSTRYLEYEAYEPMALSQMHRLREETIVSFEVHDVGVVHRLGRLEVGDTSVTIVVSAPHRGPAFRAAESMIDRLKREVPIWKKEYFVDGEVWVEGAWDAQLLARR